MPSIAVCLEPFVTIQASMNHVTASKQKRSVATLFSLGFVAQVWVGCVSKTTTFSSSRSFQKDISVGGWSKSSFFVSCTETITGN